MYCLSELLTVVGAVVVLAMILFVVGAAVIVVDEGIRSALGLLAKWVRQVAGSSIVVPKGWNVAISVQLGSLNSKGGKL
jgi:hypothetical protein